MIGPTTVIDGVATQFTPFGLFDANDSSAQMRYCEYNYRLTVTVTPDGVKLQASVGYFSDSAVHEKVFDLTPAQFYEAMRLSQYGYSELGYDYVLHLSGIGSENRLKDGSTKENTP